MKRLILSLLLLPLFFSCSNVDLSKLYSDGSYKQVYDISSSLLEHKITDEALYYKARSANRLGLNVDAVESAKLYTLLFSDQREELNSMRRVLLHYGSSEDALEAGLALEDEKALTKDDSIQFYKVLNDNNLLGQANKFISELYSRLSHAEYIFCLVNGGANIDRILSSLELYANENGITQEFLSSIRLLVPTVDEDIEKERLEDFFNRTFNGETRYALIIGDFYFDIQNKEKMIEYWSIAAKDFPEAVRNREIVSGVSIQ